MCPSISDLVGQILKLVGKWLMADCYFKLWLCASLLLSLQNFKVEIVTKIHLKLTHVDPGEKTKITKQLLKVV